MHARPLPVLLLLAACTAPTPAPTPPAAEALFNGRDLGGWHADVPAADAQPELPPAFVVEDGVLLSRGTPPGHLITDRAYADYRLLVEWRWPEQAGNNGVLLHCSTPRQLANLFPQSLECQLQNGNAGDFVCLGEEITVPDMEQRRGPKAQWPQKRRIANLTDGSEKPAGEWNQMVIECRGRAVDVWVNGQLVNRGTDCSAASGRIALQSEGAPCEFRRIELQPLQP